MLPNWLRILIYIILAIGAVLIALGFVWFFAFAEVLTGFIFWISAGGVHAAVYYLILIGIRATRGRSNPEDRWSIEGQDCAIFFLIVLSVYLTIFTVNSIIL
ncbi:MAG: hypothetical protein WBH31_17725 [Promethearchaeia archaeon]